MGEALHEWTTTQEVNDVKGRFIAIVTQTEHSVVEWMVYRKTVDLEYGHKIDADLATELFPDLPKEKYNAQSS